MKSEEPIEIVGAGPAGLAAAIVAAKLGRGRRVVVYEQHADVGAKFHGDFQGLENWTTSADVLDELAGMGIEPRFSVLPVREQVCFGPRGQRQVLHSVRPVYYLVRRGPTAGSLDACLKQQALELGVDLRLQQRAPRTDGHHVVAKGPARAVIVAAGYLFETDQEDGCYAVMSNRLAPGGYGYLLVWNGQATLAVCAFSDYHRVSEYLERTANFFQEKTGIAIKNPRTIGGAGDVYLPQVPDRRRSFPTVAGEAAGIQDALWGFGIRYALLSGSLAGRLAAGDPPEALRVQWRKRISDPVRSSFVNRWLCSALGDHSYRLLLAALSRSSDPGLVLRAIYRPRWWKDLLSPLAAGRLGRPRD